MRRIPITLVMLTLVALAATPPVHGGDAYRDPIYGISYEPNLVYGIGDTSSGPKPLLCDVYRPVDIGLGPVPENGPCIVVQDGGSWVSASKTAGRVVIPAQYMVRRGFTAVITDYRQTGDGTTNAARQGKTEFGNRPWVGLSVGLPVSLFPGINAVRCGIEDFAVGIAWTRRNAAMLGIDPNRIGACGGSAGGIDLLMLQYNNNNLADPCYAAYAAQAVMGIVSTMYTNWNKINAGAPPAFMLNNTSDTLIWYSPDVPNFNNKLTQLGVYHEQWFQRTELTHDFDYDECIYDPNDANLPCVDVKERMTEFFCYHLADGPLQVGYTLTLSANPPAAGTITADPPPRGDGTYEGGTIVTLTANPTDGHLFNNWSGDASGSANPTTVTMNGHKSVTANFADGQSLTLNVVNDLWGTVAVEPNLPLYAPGAAVTLTAIPIEGKAFREWTIWSDPNLYPDGNYAAIDSNLVLQLTMDHDYMVEAAFKCGSGAGDALPLLAISLTVVGFVSRTVRRRS